MNFLWDNIFRNSTKENLIRQALRENILFKDLSDREIKLLEGLIHLRRYHAGEPIFKQGEIGVGLYIILSGRVEISMVDDSSAEESKSDIYITQLITGDFFGELALVDETNRRSASATAREATELIGFFKPDLFEVIKRRPATGIKVLFRLSEVLGRRLTETTEKVTDLRRTLKELREPPPINSGR